MLLIPSLYEAAHQLPCIHDNQEKNVRQTCWIHQVACILYKTKIKANLLFPFLLIEIHWTWAIYCACFRNFDMNRAICFNWDIRSGCIAEYGWQLTRLFIRNTILRTLRFHCREQDIGYSCQFCSQMLLVQRHTLWPHQGWHANSCTSRWLM